MSRIFSRFFTFSNLPRRAPDTGYWVRPSRRADLTANNPQSGIKFDHPQVADPAQPNPDGTLDLKWQGTSGNGSATNPSKLVNPNVKITGKPGLQNMVNPETPVKLDPKDLTKIPNSDLYLDQSSNKHNIHAGGGKPSNYLNKDKYLPPGETDQ